MMNYIYVDGERIELATIHPYQIYVNGKFIAGAFLEHQNMVIFYSITKTLQTLGVNFKVNKAKKDNIIDGYLEVRNFITIKQ